jgi:hypothetical protein
MRWFVPRTGASGQYTREDSLPVASGVIVLPVSGGAYCVGRLGGLRLAMCEAEFCGF